MGSDNDDKTGLFWLNVHFLYYHLAMLNYRFIGGKQRLHINDKRNPLRTSNGSKLHDNMATICT